MKSQELSANRETKFIMTNEENSSLLGYDPFGLSITEQHMAKFVG